MAHVLSGVYSTAVAETEPPIDFEVPQLGRDVVAQLACLCLLHIAYAIPTPRRSAMRPTEEARAVARACNPRLQSSPPCLASGSPDSMGPTSAAMCRPPSHARCQQAVLTMGPRL